MDNIGKGKKDIFYGNHIGNTVYKQVDIFCKYGYLLGEDNVVRNIWDNF